MKKTQIMTAVVLTMAMLTGCAGNAATTSTAGTETTAATTAAETTAAETTAAETTAAETTAAETTAAETTAAQTEAETKAETTAAETTAAESEEDLGGQNPVMNFIGTYSNGRGMMEVSCSGMDGASIHVTWSGSAAESSTWDMSGTVENNGDELTLNYTNCVKNSKVFSEDGSVESDTQDYTDGSGVIHFNSNNTITWEDHKENIADGSVFEYAN